MSKDQRIYVVTQGDTKRLVRAKSGPAAHRFVASDITYQLASQNDIVSALGAGIKVEDSVGGDSADEQEAA